MDQRHDGLRLSGRHDEGAWERQPGSGHVTHQAVAMAVQHAFRRIDRQRFARDEVSQALRCRRPLAHVHVQLRRGQPARRDFSLAGARHVPAPLLQTGDGVVEDGRVVAAMHLG